MKFDSASLDNVIEIIRRVVREELQKELRNINTATEQYRHVKVISPFNEIDTEGKTTSTPFATVQDMVTNEIIQKVPNKSGEILLQGDIVRIYETNGGFHNKYIGLNCGQGKE